jgi:serine/threonine-protein kinase RsbT
MPSYSVRDPIDVFHVRSCIARFATELGFNRRESQELAIVASELASNILKYGGGGELSAEPTVDDERAGLKLVASDRGPPFRNLESALKDGWDDDGPIDPMHYLKRKGIGGGLGAIVRLTDTFAVNETALGKQIVTRRYLK